MVKIKICGLKRLEDIEIVNKYGPDFIGFVFAESPRKVNHYLAKQLKDNLNSDIKAVGVFVDNSQEEVIELFNRGIIDIAQLHGSEDEEYIQSLKDKTNNKLKIINAIEIKDETDISQYDKSQADYLLFDSGKGSGKTFNWDLIKNNIKKPFFLAGGINSENISQAIDKFKPFAIDLSSSVEVNGFKNESKIKEIMEVKNWVEEDLDSMVVNISLKP